MDRGDDGDGKRAPDIGRLLEVVGEAMRAFREIPERRHGASGRDRRECLPVKAGAKAFARAGQHDGAQTGHAAQPLARRDDGLEHRRIERVELVRAIERDLGDANGDVDCHAVARRGQGFVLHASLPGFPSTPKSGQGYRAIEPETIRAYFGGGKASTSPV
jgi:hypothetical protein